MNILCAEKLDKRTIIESWYVSFYTNKEFYYYAMKDDSQNSLFNTLIQNLTEFNMKLYEEYFEKDSLLEDEKRNAYRKVEVEAERLKIYSKFEDMLDYASKNFMFQLLW